MKAYRPEKLVTISRYRKYFPTLPVEIRKDVYSRMHVLLEEEKRWCDKGNYNESDGLDAPGKRFEKIIDGMHCYTAKEIEKALRAAGFSEVSCDRHPSKPWIAVLARKA